MRQKWANGRRDGQARSCPSDPQNECARQHLPSVLLSVSLAASESPRRILCVCIIHQERAELHNHKEFYFTVINDNTNNLCTLYISIRYKGMHWKYNAIHNTAYSAIEYNPCFKE